MEKTQMNILWKFFLLIPQSTPSFTTCLLRLHSSLFRLLPKLHIRLNNCVIGILKLFQWSHHLLHVWPKLRSSINTLSYNASYFHCLKQCVLAFYMWIHNLRDLVYVDEEWLCPFSLTFIICLIYIMCRFSRHNF